LVSVRAYDVKNTAKGPVFTFEVTVVRPVKPDDSGLLSYDNVNFNPNSLIKRDFVLVPNKVTWASKSNYNIISIVLRLFTTFSCSKSKLCLIFVALYIKHLDSDVNANFCLHCVQLLPQKSCKFMELCKMFNMKSNEFQAHFPVEVCMTQFNKYIG